MELYLIWNNTEECQCRDKEWCREDERRVLQTERVIKIDVQEIRILMSLMVEVETTSMKDSMIMPIIELIVKTRSWKEIRGLIEKGKHRMCGYYLRQQNTLMQEGKKMLESKK